MPKKNGFIATSLIYSFFLVFIALTAALLTAYNNRNMLLDRFNEDAINKLDTDTFDVLIYSVNASRNGARTLVNRYPTDIIQEFTLNANEEKSIEIPKTFFEFKANAPYYISYVSNDSNCILGFKIENLNADKPYTEKCDTYQLNGGLYRHATKIDGQSAERGKQFIYVKNSSSLQVTYKNFLLLENDDMKGYDLSWLNKHIIHFKERVYLSTFFNLEADSSLNLEYQVYNTTTQGVACIRYDNTPVTVSSNQTKKSSNNTSKLKINNIMEDLICTAVW